MREPAATQAVAADELRKRLLAIEGVSHPLEVVAAKGGKDGDLVARWRIRDAQRRSSFHAAHNELGHRDPHGARRVGHEVRARDSLVSVRWTGNVPKVGGFSTKKPEFQHEEARQPVAHGPDPLNPDHQRQYMLDTNELKELIGEIVNCAGWVYKQVYRKKTLAGA